MTRRWGDFNREVIEEFRANAGRVERFGELDVVIVHTHRPDGSIREVPLIPVLDGDHMYLFATNAGSTRDPAWVRDLDERPEVDVEHAFGGAISCTPVHAVRLDADAAGALVDGRAATTPQLQSYLDSSGGRAIPVFRLEPPIHRTVSRRV